MNSKSQQQEQISRTRAFVRAEMERDSSGHDWWHIERVTRMARLLAEQTNAEPYLCEMAALLHDIADEKLNPSKEIGMQRVADWLEGIQVDAAASEHIRLIISTMSYGGGGGSAMATLEGQVVQDADRLDAIGVIASARTFAYSGWKGQAMFDPAIRPRAAFTKEQYRNEKSTAVNHFFEKLFKLKDLMNTQAARAIAEDRHNWMVRYVASFDAEWELGNPDYLEESVFREQRTNSVHVVFHASAAAVLHQVLHGELVVTLDDDQSFGPLMLNSDPLRLELREKWLHDLALHRSGEEIYRELLFSSINWGSWPARLAGREVIIWAGESVFEQINLRRLCAALPQDAKVSIIRTTERMFNITGGCIQYAHTGEMQPEHLLQLRDSSELLTDAERAAYAADWQRLAEEDGILRILANGELRTVPIDYWDQAIMEAVDEVRSPGAEYVPVTRVVGHVFSHSEQGINERFIYERIRTFIQEGKLRAKDKTMPIQHQQISSWLLADHRAAQDRNPLSNLAQWSRDTRPQLETAILQLQELQSRDTELHAPTHDILVELGAQLDTNQDRHNLIREYLREQKAQAERRERIVALISGLVHK